LGNQFGGDGVSTFSLPNLKPILSANEAPVQYIICLTGMFPIRE